MTYGYELEPLADTSAKLGISLPRPWPDVVKEYADAFPIVAAHAMYVTGSYVIYWVSGTSLVRIETGDQVEDAETGSIRTTGHATGRVWPLSDVPAEISAKAVSEPGGQVWTVYRTVKLRLDDAEIELPDPRSLPLDNEDKRNQVKAFLDAVLRAL